MTYLGSLFYNVKSSFRVLFKGDSSPSGRHLGAGGAAGAAAPPDFFFFFWGGDAILY